MRIERVQEIAARHGFHHDDDPTGEYEDLHDAAARLVSGESNLEIVAGSERALCHRLGVHLERVLLERPTGPDGAWDVDCEYNRDGVKKKTMRVGSQRRDGRVFPDLIVHHRGAGGSAANSLVVEMKVLRNSGEDDIDRDFEKLNAYQRRFEYQRAAFVAARSDWFATEAGSALVVFVPDK